MSLLYPLPETPADVVRAELQAFLQTDESFRGSRLEFWQTKTQGTDVVIVSPDRRIRYAGTLFINEE